MISGKDKLLNWIRANNCPYWKVFPSTNGSKSGNYLFSSSDADSIDPDSSYNHLAACLDLLSPGKYYIQAKKNSNDTKSLCETGYQHDGGGTVQQSGGSDVSGIGGGSVAEIVRRELDNYKKDLKIEQLERELADAKKQAADADDSTSRVLKKLEPFIDPALGRIFPEVEKPAKVSAIGFGDKKDSTQTNNSMPSDKKYTAPVEPAKSNDEASARYKAASEAWMNVDSDSFLYVIEKIADTAVNDPTTYAMYRNMLLKK